MEVANCYLLYQGYPRGTAAKGRVAVAWVSQPSAVSMILTGGAQEGEFADAMEEEDMMDVNDALGAFDEGDRKNMNSDPACLLCDDGGPPPLFPPLSPLTKDPPACSAMEVALRHPHIRPSLVLHCGSLSSFCLASGLPGVEPAHSSLATFWALLRVEVRL